MLALGDSVQSASQPSDPSLVPSSHASVPCLTPSPQYCVTPYLVASIAPSVFRSWDVRARSKIMISEMTPSNAPKGAAVGPFRSPTLTDVVPLLSWDSVNDA